MLTREPTLHMIREWQRIFQENKDTLSPGRRSGEEVEAYFCEKYQPEKLLHPAFARIAEENLLQNDHSRNKLPPWRSPEISVYGMDHPSVLIAIDRVTGFFQIESSDTARMSEIYDDLFLFRGLDEQDLENCFLTAQYIQLSQKESERQV